MMTRTQARLGTTPYRAARALRRGVSLIEALVAMAVMAFGMLGVLGLQATLRTNADLSKQRSEATRLAQEKIEAWRSFSVIAAAGGAKSYAVGIPTGTASETLTSFSLESNATYTRTTTVTESSPVGHKTLAVDVSWPDRTGTTQNVRLISAVAQISPDLAATAVAPPHGLGGVRNPGGRARGIPPQAKNFGDGTSGFRPPQAVGDNVAWVFSNTTGLIEKICTTSAANNATLTLASLTACVDTQKYQLLNGFIRFATGPAQPSATTILNPELWTPETGIEVEVVQNEPTPLAGTVACFHERPPTFYVQYFCAVPVRTTDFTPTPPPTLPAQRALTWAGALRIKPTTLPTLSGTLAEFAGSGRKVCRYRAAASYTGVNLPLTGENLVVISAGDAVSTPFVCPTAGAGPSWPHQPAS